MTAAGTAFDRFVLRLQHCSQAGWVSAIVHTPWQEEEEEAAGGSGVCNRIGGCDGDSCGGRGLRRGLGQMEKSWARGLCSFIILEAALLGHWDPHSSIESPAPSATNTACPRMLSHMWGGSQGSSIHRTGRLWKKGEIVNPSPPPPFASCVVMGKFGNFCLYFLSGRMETA